ncbi:MAG: carboxypeptidase regulatory-like domain-containing protein [Gemmatimonadota bacterium]
MRRGPARAGPATVAAAVLLAGSASALAAQAATVQGIVQSESGELLEHVEVVLAAGGVDRHQTFTDRNGFYRIVGVAPGPYALRAGRIGYRGREEPLVLEAGERRTVSLRLAPLAVEVEGIVVTPEQGAAVRDLGRQVVTSVDLAAVPAPGGTGDLATYLRTLPGVTATGDRGGQLFVRGGTPTSNLVLVDGVPVYQPFHIVGFFSAFPEELVSTADFYAGGYGARYSGRTSSVLDVRLRPPETMDGRSLTASLSPFLVEALVEGRGGPFPNGSWLVSARRSLIEETSNVILGEEQPLTFESQLVKFTSDQRGDVWCSALALRTRDRGRIDPDDSGSRVAWGNLAAGLRCSGIWPNGEMIEAHMGYSSSTNDAVTGENAGLHSRIWRVYTDVHTNRTVGSVPVDAGFQGYIESLEYDMAELFVEQQDGETLFVGSAYAEAELSVGDRLEVRPGAVLVVSPTLGIEPRLRARWEPFGRDDAAVQGALGLYRQHAVGVSDLRDVGSVFVAWLEPETPMRAFHGRLGWQQRLGGGFRWSLEVPCRRRGVRRRRPRRIPQPPVLRLPRVRIRLDPLRGRPAQLRGVVRRAGPGLPPAPRPSPPAQRGGVPRARRVPGLRTLAARVRVPLHAAHRLRRDVPLRDRPPGRAPGCRLHPPHHGATLHRPAARHPPPRRVRRAGLRSGHRRARGPGRRHEHL